MLDTSTGEIVMPLDDYDVFATQSDKDTLGQARYIAEGKCMEPQGFRFSAAHLTDSPGSSPGDRPYGIWNVQVAQTFGYEFPATTVRPSLEHDAEIGGQTWLDALEKCGQNLDSEAAGIYPTNDELMNSVVETIRGEAFIAATADPAWQAAREKWWTCLTDAGLQPRKGANEWGSQEGAFPASDAQGNPLDPEKLIKIAYTEAECNIVTGMAQSLGDLEASYQQPLIDRDQAALNSHKTDKEERLQRARDYISAYGSMAR